MEPPSATMDPSYRSLRKSRLSALLPPKMLEPISAMLRIVVLFPLRPAFGSHFSLVGIQSSPPHDSVATARDLVEGGNDPLRNNCWVARDEPRLAQDESRSPRDPSRASSALPKCYPCPEPEVLPVLDPRLS